MESPALPIPAPLSSWARVEGELLTLRVPLSAYLVQALLIFFLLPLASWALILLVALTEPALTEGAGMQVLTLLGVGLHGAAALVGLVMGLGAPLWSARSKVTLDPVEGELRLWNERLPLSSVRGLNVGRPSRVLKWWGMSVELADGSSRPLLGRVPPGKSGSLGELGKALARWRGWELRLSSKASDSMGLDEKQAAALCYLPVQGLFLIASAYYLITDKNRPRVRFAARQSLLQLGASVALLLACLAVGGGTLAVTGWLGLEVIGIVVFSVLLLAFFVWNVGARVVACYRAYSGRVWVMPWLKPFEKRWTRELEEDLKTE